MISGAEKRKLAGTWHIFKMSGWDTDYINMEVQAYIHINKKGMGGFQFGLVSGQVDGRFEKDTDGPIFDFTWEGSDEGEPMSGDGWMIARNDGSAEGEFRIHLGDSSLFWAQKVYSSGEIEQKVLTSIDSLLKYDSYLLEKNANELSITHKLACYLEKEFAEWDVDCEYNLKFDAENLIKRLESIEQCSGEKMTDRVIPDIIIHKRDSNNNLLVIEIKKGYGNLSCDIEKLKLFTSNGEYNYKHGLFIKFHSTDEPNLKWIENGQEAGNEK